MRTRILKISLISLLISLLCACGNADAQAPVDSVSSEAPQEDIKEVTPDVTTETSEEVTQEANSITELPPIIWLGDSLTQGSLWDDNGNVNNPQAPWRVIADKYDVDITGYGYYGYNTHDILWKYGEDGGQKISDNIYVFWVGSNDFVQSADTITDVIGEIDRFVEAGSITKYVVIGTTDREALGRDKAVAINKVFEDTYGSKYLDILEYVEYGPDKTHLTADSYAQIADAVYNKIIDTYK